MSSRGCVGPSERCLHQAVVKLAHDLCYAEREYRQAKLQYVVDMSNRASISRYWHAWGRREALREMAGNLLRMGRATKPVNRRALWRSYRHGWRVARCLTTR